MASHLYTTIPSYTFYIIIFWLETLGQLYFIINNLNFTMMPNVQLDPLLEVQCIVCFDKSSNGMTFVFNNFGEILLDLLRLTRGLKKFVLDGCFVWCQLLSPH